MSDKPRMKIRIVHRCGREKRPDGLVDLPEGIEEVLKFLSSLDRITLIPPGTKVHITCEPGDYEDPDYWTAYTQNDYD